MMSAFHLSGVGPRIRRAGSAGASPLGAALIAGFLALGLVLFGPPGGDAAAHLYMTQAWRDHGWQLWDNFWYSGRYAQVNYSLLFYPLAALLHPTTVVVASCAGAAGAFAALLRRRWPTLATGPSLAFALLVPLAVVAGTYPFLLGLAIALGTILALQAGRPYLALAGVLATGLAHPLALAFLLVVLLAIAVVHARLVAEPPQPGPGRRGHGRGGDPGPAAAGLLDGRRALPVRSQGRPGDRRVLRRGAAADPRTARPALPAGGVRGLRGPRGRRLLALVAGGRQRGAADAADGGAAADAAPRRPRLPPARHRRGAGGGGAAVAGAAGRGRLAHRHRVARPGRELLVPGDRVGQRAPGAQPAGAGGRDRRQLGGLLPGPAGRPAGPRLVPPGRLPRQRGALRAPDGPQLSRRWLRRTGVHYVFLPDDPLDYSAGNEAELLRSGESGLREVAQVGGWTVFELPKPTPIATPADGISIVSLTSDAVTLRVERPGTYRLRLRYTPYWSVEQGYACATPREPWGTDLRVTSPGIVRLSFDVRLGTFVGAVLGSDGGCGSPVYGPPAPLPPAASSN